MEKKLHKFKLTMASFSKHRRFPGHSSFVFHSLFYFWFTCRRIADCCNGLHYSL